MKITKSQLKRIIKEELSSVLNEDNEDNTMSVQDMYDRLVDNAPEGAIEKFEDDRRAYAAKKYGSEDKRVAWTLLDALEHKWKHFDPTEDDYENILSQMRAMAAGPVTYEDPDSDEDDAAELEAGLDLTGFELTKDRGYYFIVDKESGERVLGPFRTEGQAEERAMRPDTRSEFEAAQDVLDRLR